MSTYLPLGIAENDRLCDCERVVEIAQRVKFPVFALHSDKELLDAFQRQLITLDEDADGVRHELARHLENLVRQSSGHENDLCAGRQVAIHVVDLLLEPLV